MVDPDFRGQGLGRAVVTAASRFALENGSDEVLLQTQPASPLERFCQSIGYSTLFVADTIPLLIEHETRH